jgi:hypothetical protein
MFRSHAAPPRLSEIKTPCPPSGDYGEQETTLFSIITNLLHFGMPTNAAIVCLGGAHREAVDRRVDGPSRN